MDGTQGQTDQNQILQKDQIWNLPRALQLHQNTGTQMPSYELLWFWLWVFTFIFLEIFYNSFPKDKKVLNKIEMFTMRLDGLHSKHYRFKSEKVAKNTLTQNFICGLQKSSLRKLVVEISEAGAIRHQRPKIAYFYAALRRDALMMRYDCENSLEELYLPGKRSDCLTRRQAFFGNQEKKLVAFDSADSQLRPVDVWSNFTIFRPFQRIYKKNHWNTLYRIILGNHIKFFAVKKSCLLEFISKLIYIYSTESFYLIKF